MIDKEKLRDMAEYFWECAMRYAGEMEFGNPDLAEDFEECWKKYMKEC